MFGARYFAAWHWTARFFRPNAAGDSGPALLVRQAGALHARGAGGLLLRQAGHLDVRQTRTGG